MKFGRLLREYRTSRGYQNRSKFARAIKVSPEFLRLIEVGKRLPSIAVLNAMIGQLGLEQWESTQLRIRLLEARFRQEAAEVLGSNNIELTTLFSQRFTPLVEEVMEDLPEDKRIRNAVYLTGAAEYILNDILGQAEEDDSEVPDSRP